MPEFLKWIYENIADSFAIPARLVRTIEENPSVCIAVSAPPKTICFRSSIVRWDDWHDRSLMRYSKTTVRGWCNTTGYGYTGTTIEIPELAELVKCEISENWCCDIRDVDGLLNSKSPIEKIQGMDNFAEQCCGSFVDEISEEKLQKNLAHKEIRIIHGPGSDHFTCCGWDGRTFLLNSGGSHHFTAARYIAGKLNRPLTLKGKLYKYNLNAGAIEALLRKFDIFAIKNGSAYDELFDPLKAFHASFFTLDLPKPYDGGAAIFLPRAEQRSRRVAETLRNAKFYDLGVHLSELVRRQA